jgi:tRNA (cmo5U34)-methyltransferase
MVMDEPQGVAEYDRFGAAAQVPLHHLNALAISRLLGEGGTVLDLGCGSARLLARLAHGRPDARIVGLDLSEPMLETGRSLLAREGLAGRVQLRRGDITTFDSELPERPDVVCCNLALHQLPSDELVHRCLEAIGRVRARTGCAVHVFDIARLRNPRSLPAMLSLVVMPGRVVLGDAIASERAAFTFAELTDRLGRAGLADLRHVRSRLLGEYQLHWAAAREPAAPGAWRDAPLPSGTRLATRILLASFPRSVLAHRP